MRNTEFWNKEGVEKVFTHPVCTDWLAGLDRHASILDLGCGYGRLTPELRREGFSNIFGYDASVPLIARAIQENPGASYTSNIADLSAKSFNLILCFALFTSCPSSEEQRELVLLIDRHAHEDALLYISDYETGDNQNYRDRYEQCMLNIYGCFASENAIFHHHESGHFDCLLPEWIRLEERRIRGRTLNGNDITVHQYLYARY